MNIFILEDSPERVAWFRHKLVGHTLWVTADTNAGKSMLRERNYSVIFLDHDLEEAHYSSMGYNETSMRGTGRDVAKFIAGNDDVSPNATIVIHSCNPLGAAWMSDALRYDSVTERDPIVLPFTTLRQLVGLTKMLGLE